jgi:SIR2-like domain
MDDILNLAFSIHRNPGVYALLLGSGISRSVGIPTGWEITQDLSKQVKEAGGEEFRENMQYDEMLEILGKTQNERNTIIREYIDPTEQEREEGIKVPSQAHHAIAKLIKDGYIKVVLTTNFDRLLEIALQNIGAAFDVISSDDMLDGVTPIRHSKITIIKLHGDYRDVRTLNTSEELSNYSSVKNKVLSDIFDEYGLIICGWSAQYDMALRDAIYRVKSRRYSSYWIEPNVLSQEAKELINHRKAILIPSSADTLFVELQGKVEALAKINREHPLTVAVAVERVKKLMAREENRIELEELIRDEAERAYQTFTKLNIRLPRERTYETIDAFHISLLTEYFTSIEVVLNIAAAFCWYSKKGEFISVLIDILARWASPMNPDHERVIGNKIPALLLLYVCSIAFLYRANWNSLRAIVIDPKVISFRSSKQSVILEAITKREMFQYSIYDADQVDPISLLLRKQIRPIFQGYLPSDSQFLYLFDLLEMVLALISLDNHWGWISHNAAKHEYFEYGKHEDILEFWVKGAREGHNWGILKEFFDGNVSKLEVALDNYHQRGLQESRWSSHQIPDYRDKYKSSFRE